MRSLILAALAGVALAAPSLKTERGDAYSRKISDKLNRRGHSGQGLVKRQGSGSGSSSGSGSGSSGGGGGITDTQILQYALTLEHLENTFYNTYLGMYDDNAFTSAGYPDWVRPRFEMIAQDEQTHVDFLTMALGSDAVSQCSYSFPVNSVADFTTVAMMLETTGVSAYLGAAQNISNPTYLTYAGSILTVEARHTAWESADVLFQSAFPHPFDTPLDFSEVYSIASQFITNSDCSANANLPVKAFPPLAVSGTPSPGGSITLQPSSSAQIPSSGVYAVFYQGPLAPYAVSFSSGQPVQIPGNITDGVSFVVLSTSQMPTDDSILSGPAIVNIPSYIQ